jgi:hypothetical protein
MISFVDLAFLAKWTFVEARLFDTMKLFPGAEIEVVDLAVNSDEKLVSALFRSISKISYDGTGKVNAPTSYTKVTMSHILIF